MIYSKAEMKKKPEDIKKLEEQIKALSKKEQQARATRTRNEYTNAAQTGMRVAIELVSGVIVGAAIGWFLDDIFGTKPLFLTILLLLGGAAGFLNVYRFVKSEGQKTKE